MRPSLPSFVISPVLCLGLAAALLVPAVALGVDDAMAPALGTRVLGQSHWLTGTKVNLHVLTLDRTKDAPVEADVEVWVERGKKSERVFSGRSGRSGTLKVSFKAPAPGDVTLRVETRAPIGKDTVRVSGRVESEARTLLTTDKPLYQPGQTVHLRALTLGRPGNRPVADHAVTFEVRDPRGNRVMVEKVRTSKFGISHAIFVIGSEVSLGEYKIKSVVKATKAEGRGTLATAEKSFKVQRYVLPKFKVAVETDKRYYMPGETLKGTLNAKYFFGKTVAGKASVTLSTYAAGWATVAELKGDLDAEGAWRFEAKLPDSFVGMPATGGQAILKVEAAVVDTADHREQSTTTLPVVSDPIQVAVVPDAAAFAPGLPARAWLVTSYPDGRPAQAKVTIKAMMPGAASIEASTDATGLGEVSLPLDTKGPAVSVEQRVRDRARRWGMLRGRCPGVDRPIALELEVRDEAGRTAKAVRCVSEAADGSAVLLRVARPLARVGDAVEIEILSNLPEPSSVFLEVVANGQSVTTETLDLAGGRASMRLPLGEELVGTALVQAWAVTLGGDMISDRKVLVVEPSGGLQVTARPDKATFEPGADGRVAFAVTDASGRPTIAALGITVVDESLLALAEQGAGLERLFFQLEEDLLKPRVEVHGWDLKETLGDGVLAPEQAAQRERKARVLLAAAAGAMPFTVDVDTWQDKVDKATEVWPARMAALNERVYKAVIRYAKGKRVAEPKEGEDMAPALLSAGVLRKRDLLDPAGVAVRILPQETPFQGRVTVLSAGPDRKFETGDDTSLDGYEAEQQLLQRSVAAAGRKIEKALIAHKKAKGAFPKPTIAIGALLKAGLLARRDLRDPFGGAWRFDLTNMAEPWGGFPSDFGLHGAGLDGKWDTGDDARLWYEPSEGWRGRPGRRFPMKPMAERKVMLRMELDGAGGGGLGRRALGAGGGADMQDKGAQARPKPAEPQKVAARDGKVSHSGGAQPEARVRSWFPETLFVKPELVTDAQGKATATLPIADSITTWRMLANAISAGGLLGSVTSPIRVFQDFFVDLDLPVAFTEGDEVGMPVAVYNYLNHAQKVRLKLDPGRGFEALEGTERELTIGSGEVTAARFRVKAVKAGSHPLTVHATGESMSDAVKRTADIAPDGKELWLTHAESVEAGKPRELSVDVPKDVLASGRTLLVKVQAGVFNQIVDGLERLLQVPSGCFEQTSSTTYPNVLVLGYLKRVKRAQTAVELQARTYISMGWQKLLTFEVRGGGFSWFGEAPANAVLTAYGLLEFSDMGKVFPVDDAVLSRTASWLASRQGTDGSWSPDQGGIAEGAIDRQTDALRTTAYITWALGEAKLAKHGAPKESIARGVRYLQGKVKDAADPYALALILNALVVAREVGVRSDATVIDVLAARLAMQGRLQDGAMSWAAAAASNRTPFKARGESADLETTAMVTYALLRHGGQGDASLKGLAALVKGKDAFGTWHTTQATVWALKALILASERGTSGAGGELVVRIGNDEVARWTLTPETSDVLRQVDATKWLHEGRNLVSFDLAGKGSVTAQTSARVWLPWSAVVPAGPEPLSVKVDYDRTDLAVHETLTARVHIENRTPAGAEMLLVDVGLPPGFDLVPDRLVEDVKKTRLQKFEPTPRQLTLYLERLGGKARITFTFELRARMPVKAKGGKSVAQEYYLPQKAFTAPPLAVTVK